MMLERFYPLLFFCCTWGSVVLCAHNARIFLMCHLQGLAYRIDSLGIAPVDI